MEPDKRAGDVDESTPVEEMLEGQSTREKGKSREDEQSSQQMDARAVAIEILEQLAGGVVKRAGTSREHNDDLQVLERFLGNRPREFHGKHDPKEAFEWLESMEKLWRVMRPDEYSKVRLATHMFQGSAESWWKLKSAQITPNIAWGEFRKIFEQKYYPDSYRHQQIRDLMHLRQDNMTVAEYADKFIELVGFAPYIVPTPEAMAQKFEQGLKYSIQRQVSTHTCKTFEDILEKSFIAERGVNLEEQQPQSYETSGSKRKDVPTNPTSGSSSNSAALKLKRPFVQHSDNQWAKGENQDIHPQPNAPSHRVQGTVQGLSCVHCGLAHSSENCRKITGGCYKCGSTDHRIKDCPEMKLPPSSGACYRCGSKDHRVKNCTELKFPQLRGQEPGHQNP